MQPHIHLTDTEPYRWPDDKKGEQIAGITRTLDVAEYKHIVLGLIIAVDKILSY